MGRSRGSPSPLADAATDGTLVNDWEFLITVATRA